MKLRMAVLTVDKVLLLQGDDASQVGPLHTTLPLCRVPAAAMGEVLVAVALELVPTITTRLRVCGEDGSGP